jgi:hypothetical protein
MGWDSASCLAARAQQASWPADHRGCARRQDRVDLRAPTRAGAVIAWRVPVARRRPASSRHRRVPPARPIRTASPISAGVRASSVAFTSSAVRTVNGSIGVGCVALSVHAASSSIVRASCLISFTHSTDFVGCCELKVRAVSHGRMCDVSHGDRIATGASPMQGRPRDRVE